MNDRATLLKERLKNLKKLKEDELIAKNPSQPFIDDLNDSIAGCKRELKFLDKNPGGVEFVNGV